MVPIEIKFRALMRRLKDFGCTVFVRERSGASLRLAQVCSVFEIEG